MLDVGGRRERGRDPVRRRHERRRRRRGARRRALRRRGLARPRRARPRARGRRRLARRAHPGRRARPGAGGAARAARPHAAPLPAVVRVLDARRLDRDARRRPLRDAARRTSTTSSSRCARSRRRGVWESRRLPGSGAGPSPDRMLLGSEGTLGSSPRRGCACGRADRAREPGGALRRLRVGRGGRARARAVRPAAVELPPARRARGGADVRRRRLGGAARARLRVRGSAGRPAAWRRALALCASTAARGRSAAEGARGGATGAWREAFLRAPYLRDVFVAIGRPERDVRDRDHVGALRRASSRTKAATRAAVREVCGAEGIVTCRFTHVYPDGPAPYFTVARPGAPRRGARAVGRDQARRGGRDHRRRRHDHAPPRRRPRPPPLVRPPAPRAVRRRAARREGGRRSGRAAEPRRADRPARALASRR